MRSAEVVMPGTMLDDGKALNLSEFVSCWRDRFILSCLVNAFLSDIHAHIHDLLKCLGFGHKWCRRSVTTSAGL